LSYNKAIETLGAETTITKRFEKNAVTQIGNQNGNDWK
jgi:hypothetical protein